ncbi:TIGR00282 family metallophosphoesterase [Planctomycetota bacterium]
MKLNILCIGDIVGRPGRRILAEQIKTIVREREIDCVIANAENIAGGSGITPQIYEKLLRYGVHLITLGDHVFRKREIVPVLEKSDNITRPANLSEFAAGSGYGVYQTHKGVTVGVISLIGRLFMKPADCPYAAADRLISKLQNSVDVLVVDMHAEATSEKIAMGFHVDGRASCCFGTHTHVTTADECILPKGTAYITDLGMTGAHDSVLGRKTGAVLKALRTQMPVPFEIATEGVRLNGIVVTVDSHSKRAEHIERIRIEADHSESVAYDADDGQPNRLNNQF